MQFRAGDPAYQAAGYPDAWGPSQQPQQVNPQSVPSRNPPGYGASGFGLPLRRDHVVAPFEQMHPESLSAERAPLTMFEEAFQQGSGIAPRTTLLEAALAQTTAVTAEALPIRPTQAPQLGPPSVSDNMYTEMPNLNFSRPASDAGSRTSFYPASDASTSCSI